MSSIDKPEPGVDPLGPPVIPTLVGCLHCCQEYDSYLIEWRVKKCADGRSYGFWCCPTPGCGGVGFGMDILPADPNYQDEHGGWCYDDDSDDEDADLDAEQDIDSEETDEAT